MTDIAAIAARAERAEKMIPLSTAERDRAALLAVIATLRTALEPFAKYHALDGLQNGHHEDELIVGIRGSDGAASISYGDLWRAAEAYAALSALSHGEGGGNG